MVRLNLPRRRLLLGVLALLGTFIFAPAVAAAAPEVIQASGTHTLTSFEATPIATVGDIQVLRVATTAEMSGTFSGTTEEEATCVVNADGVMYCVARETFTGTVAGRSGTAQFFSTYTVEGVAVNGQFAVVDGTGELLGLRGRVSFQGTGGPSTYSGEIMFLP